MSSVINLGFLLLNPDLPFRVRSSADFRTFSAGGTARKLRLLLSVCNRSPFFSLRPKKRCTSRVVLRALQSSTLNINYYTTSPQPAFNITHPQLTQDRIQGNRAISSTLDRRRNPQSKVHNRKRLRIFEGQMLREDETQRRLTSNGQETADHSFAIARPEKDCRLDELAVLNLNTTIMLIYDSCCIL